MSIYDKASLVLIPSGTKTSKVYSQKPVNGDGDFTFSRSTAATRVNADGNIEKETGNLLLQSNSFDTTWSISGSTTLSSGQSGYDGSNNAWLLSKSGGQYRRIYQSVAISGVCTLSVYAKANTLNQITLRDGSTNDLVRYDLSDGSLVSTAGSPITYSIVSVGNGWWRCSLTMSSSVSPNIYVDWSQSAAGSIYIQDAQLEQGLVSRDVITTTTTAVEGGITDNVPRLDYTDSSCPALLLEPQRTNELQHSEYVSDWAQNTADITLSDNLSPEGYKNCWRVEGTASGTQVGVATFNRTQGATYTTSIWIRKVSGSDTAIFRDVNNNSNTINITTEWERYTLTSTTSSTTARLYVMVADVGDVIEVYGAQLELGSYATSYIPTYGTSVTRNADECLKTGVSSLIGQTEGTLFAEFEIKSTDTDNFNRVIAIGDGTSNNRIMIFANNDEKPRAFVSDSGATQVSIIGNTSILGGTHKIAFAYKANDFVLYMDGVSLGTDTSGSVPSLSNIYLASAEDGNIRPIEGGLKQTLLFKTRLTNAELADLTTL